MASCSLGDLALGLLADRLIRNEQALQSSTSFVSPPQRQTGVLVVPQLVHFCEQSNLCLIAAMGV